MVEIIIKNWNALNQNQVALILFIIGTVVIPIVVYFWKKWIKSSTPTPSIQGDTNTQTTNRGTAIINTGSGNVITGDTYHIGITLEQYEQGLKHREVEVRKELKKKDDIDRQRKEIELHAVQQQLQNISASYEAHITSLKERIIQLDGLRGKLADDVLTDAINAVAKGHNEQADQLFKQIEEQADSVIKVAAEAAYQRYKIAEGDIRYVEALEHCEKAVRLAPTNTLYLNQAGAINQTLANYSKAIEYFDQALSSDLKTYGEDHPNVAIRRNNLGLAWKTLGEYQKAIGYYELALSSDLKTFGEDHPNVAIRRNNLGSAWKALGEYQKAIGYYEQALSSDLKTYGEAHPDVAIYRNNLGLAWYSLGEYQKAIGYYELALSSDLKTYGEAHPQVAIYRNNLSTAWYSLGEYQKAIGYYELALVTMEKRLKNHPNTEVLRNNLTSAREKLAKTATK